MVRSKIKNSRLLTALVRPLRLVRSIFYRIKANRSGAAYSRLLASIEEGSVVIQVPDFEGRFEMDIRSDLTKRLVRIGEYEPQLAQIVRDQFDPSRDAIDVGANVGFFTVLMAKLGGNATRVLSVEPMPNAIRFLTGNIARNGCGKKVEVFQGCASDSRGEFTLRSVQGKEEYTTMGRLVHPSIIGQEASEVRVTGVPLDELVEEKALRPGFIKIDTEGAEAKVLAGASRTLQEHRPIVLTELSDRLLSSAGSSAKIVIDMLIGHGYVVQNAFYPEEGIRFPFEGEILATPLRRTPNGRGSSQFD